MTREKIVRIARISLRNKEEEEAIAVLNYLKNERKFSDEIIDKFDFGYCPKSKDTQLAGRIITPIYNEHKELVALSTRHTDRNHKLRFWHESFDKGLYLYGLCYAKESILKTNKVILVEGEFDVACFHSFGVNCTVGILGTALTYFQICLLSRYCSNFYLMFDGDDAGRKAIDKALDIYKLKDLKYNKINFFPVFLPKGTDPDDFIINEGKEGLKKILKESEKNI